MDKWDKLYQRISQRITLANLDASTADGCGATGACHKYLVEATTLIAVLALMGQLEDTDGPDAEKGIPAPKHGHSREFSGPGIGGWDDLSTWE